MVFGFNFSALARWAILYDFLWHYHEKKTASPPPCHPFKMKPRPKISKNKYFS